MQPARCVTSICCTLIFFFFFSGTVVLTIMAAVLVIEFTVKNNLVCVSQLQNAPTDALDSLVGVYYKLAKLRRIMQKGGVDIFPENDAFCYMEGIFHSNRFCAILNRCLHFQGFVKNIGLWNFIYITIWRRFLCATTLVGLDGIS